MRASEDSTLLTKMHTKKNFQRNGPKASCLTHTLRMHNVLIAQEGHKTKEERAKRKEKEKDGKKHKSNNIYNHSNATTCEEHAQCQQDASSSGQNQLTINTGSDTTPKDTRGEGTI